MPTHLFDGSLRSREFLNTVIEAANKSNEVQTISYQNLKTIFITPETRFEDAVTKHLEALSILTPKEQKHKTEKPKVTSVTRPAKRLI